MVFFHFSLYRHLNDTLKVIQKSFEIDKVTKCHFDNDENIDFDNKTIYSKICNLGDTKQKTSYLIVGDSHAYQLSYLINNIFSDLKINSYFVFRNSCPPLIGFKRENMPVFQRKNNTNCSKFNNAIYEYIKKIKLKI